MEMATFKVEVKSKEMIRPYSETPDHLKILHFSFTDQSAPPLHMPYMFYYQPHPSTHYNNYQTTLRLLKNSLSHTLVHFYPLAGRVEGNLLMDCNDQGVEFYDAAVSATLAQVIGNPDPEELIRLLPHAPVTTNNIITTSVQVNHFSCGGIAISVCVSHKIADAATAIAFVNAWARTARGVPNSSDTTFDTASFFPLVNLNGVYDPEDGICKEKIVTRRLVFDKEKLDELKRRCYDGRGVKLESPPTRAGVVFAFLWKKFIKIARAKPNPPEVFNVSQVVNLRTIKGSPITENHQGNLVWTVFTYTPVEPEIEYREAVGMLKAALKEVDLSYLPRIKTGECLVDAQKAFETFSLEQGNFCGFSSVIRMPLYEVDFGWGTPLWVSITTVPFQNTVFLAPTRCGQGIEAWVHLLKHDAAILDQDHDCRSLALTPLRITPKL